MEEFLKNPNQHNASEYILTYFKSRGKEKLFNEAIMAADNGNMVSRSVHMVSAFLLGFWLQEKLQDLFPNSMGNGNWKFEYLWFLCCLYHDTYSNIEVKTQSSVSTNSYIVQAETGNGKSCTIYSKNILGVCLPEPTYQEKDIIQYFKYRKHESNKYDHGIVGGYKAFQKLVDNYMDVREKNEGQDSFITPLNGAFCGHTLVWDKQQIEAFAYAADAIIAHNIWHVSEAQTVKKYKKYGLSSFIVGNSSEEKLSIVKSPLAYLLSLVDTIEPIKWFVKNESGIRETDVFNNITICITHHSIILGKINNHSFDLKNGMTKR